MAIAILAVEEVGKMYLIRWDAKRHPRRYHAQKQSTLGSFYLGRAAVEAIHEWTTKVVGMPEDDSLKMYQMARDWAEKQPELQDQVRRFDEFIEGLIVKKFEEHPHGDLMYRAACGEIDDLKQRGLYLDIDAEGHVTRDPATVDRGLAEEWVGHARWFLGYAERAKSPAS
jgi:hypothetical protein